MLLTLFAAAIAFSNSSLQMLPLESSAWHSLKFSNILSNQVDFKEGSIFVKVNQSASPLVHALNAPTKIKQIELDVKVDGFQSAESTTFPEDSPLRVGLVLEGENRASKFKLLFSPDWVKTLMKLSPPDRGIDHIYFYLFNDRKLSVAQERVHPNSTLIKEKLEGSIVNGEMQKIIIEPLHDQNILAFWLSIDGDDTKVRFTTQIKSLGFKAEKSSP